MQRCKGKGIERRKEKPDTSNGSRASNHSYYSKDIKQHSVSTGSAYIKSGHWSISWVRTPPALTFFDTSESAICKKHTFNMKTK